MRDTLTRRLLTKVTIDPATGCWNFQQRGYGSINVRRADGGWSRKPTHRVAYGLFVGPVAPKLHLHHVCENPPCCNPEHLLPVTLGEHLTNLTPSAISYINSRKTHCPQGHPLSGDNLMRARAKQGVRGCRTCANARNARNRAARRSARGY